METTKPKPVDVVPVATKTEDVPPIKPEDARPVRPALSPELLKALDDSWERNEAAYRYLGS